MNERIEKLAKQAGFETGLVYGSPEGLQKFAELIVKECTNIVLHYTDVDEGVAVAKKHFGVEE